jgi:hypothetical protein
LRNSEIEAVTQDFPDCDRVVVDTKITNADMLAFLINHGYSIEEITDLYQLGTSEDVVLSKPLVV